MLTLTLLAETGPDPWAQLASIGIGSLIALPFIFMWRVELKARQEAEQRERAQATKATEREKEIGDAVTPLLREIAGVLPKAIEGVESVRSDKAHAVDDLLHRLETMVDQASERKP